MCTACLDRGKEEKRGGGRTSLRVGGFGAQMLMFIVFKSQASSSSCLIVSLMSLSVFEEWNVVLVGELKGVASRPRVGQSLERFIEAVGLGSEVVSERPASGKESV